MLHILIFFYLCFCSFAGWQMQCLSTPLQEITTSYPEVQAIFGYENSAWRFWRRSDFQNTTYNSFLPLQKIDPQRSYWILSEEKIEALSTCQTPPETLAPGFHMIPGTGKTVSEFFTQYPEASRIWTIENHQFLHAQNPKIYTRYRAYNSFSFLSSKKSYMVQVRENSTSVLLNSAPIAISNAKGAGLEENFFIFGGEGLSSDQKMVYGYNTKEGVWKSFPVIPEFSDYSPAFSQGVFQFEDKILFHGGIRNHQISSFMESFILSSSFVTITSIQTVIPLFSHASFQKDQTLYLLGGYDAEGLPNSYLYKISVDKTEKTTILQTFGRVESAIFDNKLYFLDEFSQLWEFDSIQFTKKNSPPQKILYSAGFSVRDAVCFAGGVLPDGQKSAKIFCFDPVHSEWFEPGTLLHKRSHATATFLNGKIYVFGGVGENYQRLSTLEEIKYEVVFGNSNLPPVVENFKIAGNGGVMKIYFDISDPEGDSFLKLDFFYQGNGQEIKPLEGLLSAPSFFSPGKNQFVTWNTYLDFSTDERPVTLIVSASDSLSQTMTRVQTSFYVYNGSPSALNPVTAGTYDQISLCFDLLDIDKDPLSLQIFYALDDTLSWIQTSQITGTFTNLSSTDSLQTLSQAHHCIAWNSHLDFQTHQNKVRLKIVPSDQGQSWKLPGITPSFIVRNGNNRSPYAPEVSVNSGYDTIAVKILIDDPDPDPMIVDLQISKDGGNTFVKMPTTPDNPLRLNPGSYSFSFDSVSVFPGVNSTSMVIRACCDDLGRSGKICADSLRFSLSNQNSPPVLTLHSVNQNSDKSLRFEFTPKDADLDFLDAGLQIFHQNRYYQIPSSHLKGAVFSLIDSQKTTFDWLAPLDFLSVLKNPKIRLSISDSRANTSVEKTLALTLSLFPAKTFMKPLVNPLIYPAVAQDETRVFLFGGKISQNTLSSGIYLYNQDSGTFLLQKEAPESRFSASSTLIQTYLYIFGGMNQNQEITSVLDIYNTNTKNFEKNIPLGIPRMDHCAVSIGDRIYFIGGQTPGGISNLAFAYLISEDRIQNLPPMKESRFGHNCFVYDHKIFVWGGSSLNDGFLKASDSMEIFDPKSFRWETGISGGEARALHSAVVLSDRVIMLGGVKSHRIQNGAISLSSSTIVSTIQVFFPSQGQWIVSDPDPDLQKVAAGAFLLSGRLSFFGGLNHNSVAEKIHTGWDLPLNAVPSLPLPPLISSFYTQNTSGEIVIHFTLDQVSSASVLMDLSLDEGKTWETIPSSLLIGNTRNLSKKSHTILWDSRTKIRTQTDAAMLRIHVWDHVSKKGNEKICGPFVINNLTETSPIQIQHLEFLTNRENILISLRASSAQTRAFTSQWFFSANQTDWQSMEIKPQNFSKETENQNLVYQWNSKDRVQASADLWFLISLQHLDATTKTVFLTGPIRIQNDNPAPKPVFLPFSINANQVSVSMICVDPATSVLDLEIEFSRDFGWSFTPISTTWSLKSMPANTAITVTWDSLKDIYDNRNSILLRARARDEVSFGEWVLSSPLNLENNNWFKGVGSKNKRSDHSASIFDNRIYYWGGTDENGNLSNLIELFDLNSGQWISKSRGGDARKDHCAVSYSGRIYFFGGENTSILDSLDIYDISSDTWLKGSSAPFPRTGHTCLARNGKIYVWGGEKFSQILNSLDVYEIESDRWTQFPAGGRPRAWHSAAVYNDKFFFYGGRDSGGILKSLDIYDPNTRIWTQGKDGITQRQSHTASVLENKMYIWGGYTNEPVNLLEVYNFTSDSWETADSGGIARYNHSASVYDGSIYFYGGLTALGVEEGIDIYKPKTKDTQIGETVNTRGWSQISFTPDRHDFSAVAHYDRLILQGGVQGSFVMDDPLYLSMDSLIPVNPPVPDHMPLAGAKFVNLYGDIFSLGGITQSFQTTSQVRSLILSSGQWSWKTHSFMPVSRKEHNAISWQSKIFVWGGVDSIGNLVPGLDVYDPQSQSWSTRSSKAEVRRQAGAVECHSRIYFFGGINAMNVATSVLDVYDLPSTLWYQVEHSFESRYLTKGICKDDKIYWFGGFNSMNEPLSEVLQLDISSQTMQKISTMPDSRQEFELISDQNRILVLGGKNPDGSSVSDSLQFIGGLKSGYPWSSGIRGGGARYGHSMVSDGEKFFVFGGEGAMVDPSKVLIFDPQLKFWSEDISGGTTRIGHSACVFSGKTWILGGKTSQENALNTMESYRFLPSGLRWLKGEDGKDLLMRKHHRMVHTSGKIYLSGGISSVGYPVATGLASFDFNDNQWVQLPVNGSYTSRYGHSIHEYNGNLYIWGGKDNTNTLINFMDIFKIQANQFIAGPQGGTSRYRFGSVKLNDRFYFLGGIGGNEKYLNAAEAYDPFWDGYLFLKGMSVARADHVAIAHENKIYVWGGRNDSGFLNSMEVYDPVANDWQSLGNGGTARAGHTGTLVDGSLVFWGGEGKNGKLDTVDIYEISAKRWVIGVPGGRKRAFSTSVPDQGKLYIFSGENEKGEITDHSDLYFIHPSQSESGKWETTSTALRERSFHTQITSDSKTYLFGGLNASGEYLNTLDLYDLSSNQVSQKKNGLEPRAFSSGFYYNDRLFFIGGVNKNNHVTNAIDIYDPKTNSWSSAPSEGTSRSHHSSVLVNDKVYVWGGFDSSGAPVNTMEIYDLSPWKTGKSGGMARMGHSAIAHENKLYFWGGKGAGTTQGTMEIYDILSDSWRIGEYFSGRSGASATKITSSIYYYGGASSLGTVVNAFILYDIPTNTFYEGVIGGQARQYHSATYWNGKIYIWGGKNFANTPINLMESYDVSTKTFASLGSGGTARFSHQAAVFEGKIYFYGGKINDTHTINQMDIYDIATNQWSDGGSGGVPRSGFSMSLVEDELWCLGGISLGNKVTEVDIYNIREKRWYKGPYGGEKRSSHAGAYTNGRIYLWGGEDESYQELNSLDILPVKHWSEAFSGGVPRASHQAQRFENRIYFFGGVDSSGKWLNSMDIFDLSQNRWISGPSGGTPRSLFASVLLDSKIYYWGGKTSTGVLNSLDIFDILSGSWDTGFVGGHARFGHGSSLYQGKIFFFGGTSNDLQILTDKDVFTSSGYISRWNQEAAAPSSRVWHQSVVLGKKMYVFGGFDSSGNINPDIDAFDFSKESWSTISYTGNYQPRAHHCAIPTGGKIYLWGGVDATGSRLDTLDIFDPQSRSFSQGNSGGNARNSHQCVAYNGRIFVWGGETASGTLNELFIYDPLKNQWTQGISGGRSRKNHTMVEKDGLLYIWGGQGSSGVWFDSMDLYDLQKSSNQKPAVVRMDMNTPHSLFGYRDAVGFSFTLEDKDQDPLSIAAEYSLNDGKTWITINSAHLGGKTTGLLSGVTQNLIWNSMSDLPRTNSQIRLRLTPSDGAGIGESKISPIFAVDNGGTWQSPSSAITARYEHSLVYFSTATRTKLLVWGGLNSSHLFINSLEMYDLPSRAWTSAPSGGRGRAGHSSMVYQNRHLLHWGGRNESGIFNSFSAYSLDFDLWIQAGALPGGNDEEGATYVKGGTPRYDHGSFQSDGKMFIWGGEGRDGVLNTLESYEFSSKTWAVEGSGGQGRRRHSTILIGRKVYFFGGIDSSGTILNTLDIYDLDSKTWTHGSKAPVSLTDHSAAVSGTRMFIFGGRNENGIQKRLFLYESGSDTWTEGQSSLGMGRRSARAGSDGNTLFIHGGVDENGNILSEMERFQFPVK